MRAACTLLLLVAALVTATPRSRPLSAEERGRLGVEDERRPMRARIDEEGGSSIDVRPGDIDYKGTGTCKEPGTEYGGRLLKKVLGINPEQIHITPWNTTSMLVSWAASDAFLGPGAVTSLMWPVQAVQAVVQYGRTKRKLNLTADGTHNNVVYQRRHTDPDEWGLTYSSPILCHVLLTNLTPGGWYHYRVGDPKYHAWSPVLRFRMLDAAGTPGVFPLHLAVTSDLATSKYTAMNADNMLSMQPDLVMYVGDLAYADMYQDNGTMDFWEMPPVAGDLRSATTQPNGNAQTRWDAFGRLVGDLVSTTPLLTVNGNHELEPEEGPEPQLIAKAYNARYPMPQDPTSHVLPTGPNLGGSPAFRRSSTNAWYAIPVAGAYIISISHYYDYTPGSEQYTWFESTLSRVNRTLYPWLIVTHHVPYYNTIISHHVEGECARKILEPLYLQYGVDFVFTGHAHAYERTHPIYNYTLNPCGYVHIQTGTGGQDAKSDFVDGPLRPAYCADTSQDHTAALTLQWHVDSETWYPAYKTGGDPRNDTCRIPNVDPPCPKRHPKWLAFRSWVYGFGSLVLVNNETATWQYITATPEATSVDKAKFVRAKQCKNRGH